MILPILMIKAIYQTIGMPSILKNVKQAYFLCPKIRIMTNYQANDKIKALLEEQANKRNGKVTPSAAMFSGPSLLFEVQGVEVEIVMTSGSWTRYGSIPGSTCIRANSPKKSEKQFHIFKEEVLGRIEKVLGFQDIQLVH